MMKDFKEIETIYRTNYSRIFIAKKYSESSSESTDELLYAVKEYLESDDIANVNTEKISSQKIENISQISVVVPVLESVDGKYLVMQYKKNGKFLGQIIEYYRNSSESIPMQVFMGIVRSILNALMVLHNCYNGFENKKGYLHMDIHPGNIFIENFPVNYDIDKIGQVYVKFIDLQNSLIMNSKGLAERTNLDYHYSNHYSAPEVYNQNNKLFNASTDIYSVAAIMLELFELIACDYTSVSNAIRSVIETGMAGSSCYRYRCVEDMLKAVDSTFELYEAFVSDNYITVADKAYYMNVNPDVLAKDAETQSKTVNPKNFNKSLEVLSNRLLNDRPNQNKCVYIFDYYNKLFEKSTVELNENKLIYVGMSCYNNVARTKDAARLAQRFFAKKNMGDFSVLDYSKTINRVSENYYDLGDIDGAIKLQQRNIRLLKGLINEYQKLVESEGFTYENEEIIQSYAKAHSALGRYLYVRSSYTSNIEGIDELEIALSLFGERRFDRNLSISHIISIAAEQKDIILCEKYVGEYFEKLSSDIKTTGDLFKAFIDNKNQSYWENNKDYELLTLLKVINAFCIEEISENNLSGFIEVMKKIATNLMSRERASYPVNLIYKYIGIILYKLNGNVFSEDVEFAMEMACSCDDSIKIRANQQLNILTIMTYQTKWLINEMKEMPQENEHLLEKFLIHSKDDNVGIIHYYKKAESLRELSEILRLT